MPRRTVSVTCVVLLAIPALAQPSVTSFTLIDADTDAPIAAFDPLLDGATLELTTLPANLNIRANTDPATVGSVVFGFDGDASYRTENSPPYAVGGDSNGDYNPWSPGSGPHTLSATAYSGSNGSGTAGPTLTVNFTVSGATPIQSAANLLYVYGASPPTLPGEQLLLSDSGGKGFSEFAAQIEAAGLTWAEALDSSLALTDAALAPYSVLVLSSNNRRFSAAEQQAVVNFVNRGGGLLIFSDAAFGFDEGPLSDNDILQHFGMEVLHDNYAGVTAVDTWTQPNYLTDGLTIRGEGVSMIRVLGAPAVKLGVCTQNCVLNPVDGPFGPDITPLAIAEVGSGRVVATFDRNTFFNPPGAGTNISEADNREYAARLIRWLAQHEPATTPPVVTGENRKWHRVEVAFAGPQRAELVGMNPFTDYRLDVTFEHAASNTTVVVPGYFAADGDAANTSASAGNLWRVIFAPDREGDWTFTATFYAGPGVAVADDPSSAARVSFDGQAGGFTILPTDKTGRDHRGKGRLEYVGERYLRFAETGETFLKGGADSPENFLAYDEFDQTPTNKHQYDPHAADWQTGNPTWAGGRGRNIIGALNYLAGKGMNSVYFLTMNVQGDGDDVWPWTASAERYRFDVSKLAQWDIVFTHMDQLGIMLHVLTQETENDQLLDGGDLGPQRRLYYRELIARFGHHLALTWNLGEENTNTNQQRRDFATFFKTHDPYRHPVIVHTFPGQKEQVYAPLLGFPDLDGPSLQVASNATVREWIDRSAAANHPWFVCYDEQAPAGTGVKPDADDFWHDDIRKNVLWGTLMAGGGGVEYYFGYNFPNDDLDCEDWRSRDHMWTLTDYALRYFRQHLPFAEMSHANDLTPSTADYVLAQPGAVYAVYLPSGGAPTLDLENFPFTYRVQWFDPRFGGALQDGTVAYVRGPGVVSLGAPPNTPTADWLVQVKVVPTLDIAELCLGGPGVIMPPIGCDALRFDITDRDNDGDADLNDMGLIQQAGGV